MVWNRQNDQADLDEKYHQLREDPFDERPEMVTLPEDYVRALEARAVRYSLMLYASRELTDGVIIREVVPMIAANAQVYSHRVMPAIEALARVKLLRKRTKREGGGWAIPNFLKYNPSKDVVERRRQSDTRLAWLQDTKLGREVRDLIQKRDGWRCRYCYIELNPNDHKSPMRGTYDHVRPNDADFDRDPRYIVQACNFHNAMKRDRTPEEAGLVLLPPWTEADAEMRRRGEAIQEVAIVVAATLAEQDPDAETIAAAVADVLNTRSQASRTTGNPTTIQPPPDRQPLSEPGRDGTGRSGSGQDGAGSETTAGGRAGEPPPHTDDHFPGEREP